MIFDVIMNVYPVNYSLVMIISAYPFIHGIINLTLSERDSLILILHTSPFVFAAIRPKYIHAHREKARASETCSPLIA